jgi:hypothetical protein
MKNKLNFLLTILTCIVVTWVVNVGWLDSAASRYRRKLVQEAPIVLSPLADVTVSAAAGTSYTSVIDLLEIAPGGYIGLHYSVDGTGNLGIQVQMANINSASSFVPPKNMADLATADTPGGFYFTGVAPPVGRYMRLALYSSDDTTYLKNANLSSN